VLHLPVKIPKAKAIEMNTQGRVVADGSAYRHDAVLLPKELSYLVPFVSYALDFESHFNPLFLEHYYLFLSVSHGTVDPGHMQRRGGWHVDGHQGYERIQPTGTKLPTDRQYTISDKLATEYVDVTLNFDFLRQYLHREICSMDSVNFQHVLELHVNQEIARRYKKEDILKSATPNVMTYFNPYVIHKAAVNYDNIPVKRTFARFLFSVYPRDRIGDSVNPIFGPIYPLKIKTITDIHEPKVEAII